MKKVILALAITTSLTTGSFANSTHCAMNDLSHATLRLQSHPSDNVMTLGKAAQYYGSNLVNGASSFATDTAIPAIVTGYEAIASVATVTYNIATHPTTHKLAKMAVTAIASDVTAKSISAFEAAADFVTDTAIPAIVSGEKTFRRAAKNALSSFNAAHLNVSRTIENTVAANIPPVVTATAQAANSLLVDTAIPFLINTAIPATFTFATETLPPVAKAALVELKEDLTTIVTGGYSDFKQLSQLMGAFYTKKSTEISNSVRATNLAISQSVRQTHETIMTSVKGLLGLSATKNTPAVAPVESAFVNLLTSTASTLYKVATIVTTPLQMDTSGHMLLGTFFKGLWNDLTK
jgi:hypothetical protein